MGGGGGPGVDLGDMLKLEKSCVQPVDQFAGPTLVSFEDEVKTVQSALQDAIKLSGLSPEEHKKRLAAGLPVVAEFLTKASSFNGKVTGVVAQTHDCNGDRTAAVDKVGVSTRKFVAKPK